MPTMYMPVTNDELELPLSPPMRSRSAVARWGGLSHNRSDWNNAGASAGFKVVKVTL